MNKRAEVEMIETIMVLVVVMLLLIIGLVFYFKSNAASIKETGQELCLLSGNDLLVALTALPEIQCSIDTVSKDCIDLDKVYAFQELLKNNNIKKQYISYFSGSCPKKVTIELVYPVPENNKECPVGEEIGKCKIWTVFKPAKIGDNKQIISTPVSIYSRGMSYIGNMVVESGI